MLTSGVGKARWLPARMRFASWSVSAYTSATLLVNRTICGRPVSPIDSWAESALAIPLDLGDGVGKGQYGGDVGAGCDGGPGDEVVRVVLYRGETGVAERARGGGLGRWLSAGCCSRFRPAPGAPAALSQLQTLVRLVPIAPCETTLKIAFDARALVRYY